MPKNLIYLINPMTLEPALGHFKFMACKNGYWLPLKIYLEQGGKVVRCYFLGRRTEIARPTNWAKADYAELFKHLKKTDVLLNRITALEYQQILEKRLNNILLGIDVFKPVAPENKIPTFGE